MTATVAESLSAWIITVAIHSTALVGVGALAAWECRRRGWLGCEEAVWRLAVLGAPATATLQLLLSSVWPPDRGLFRAMMMTLPEPSGAVVEGGLRLPGQTWPAALLLAAGLATAARFLQWSVARVRLRIFLSGRRPAPGWMRIAMDELAGASGAGVRPRLSVHDGLPAPVAFGLLRPEVSVPLGALEEGPDTLRPILAHELGHLRDRDPLWRALLDLMEVLFPWQFLLRPVRKRLQVISEFRCDSHAARWTGAGSVARGLVTAAVWMRSSSGKPAHRIDAFVGAGSLEERVDRLLRGSHQWSGLDVRFVGLLVLCLSALGPALPGVSAVRTETYASEPATAIELPTALESGAGRAPASTPEPSRQLRPCTTKDASGTPHGSCQRGGRKHGNT